MHELSIAMSIIEMAEEESDRHGAVKITAVHLKLGPLSGVVQVALENAFTLASEGTILEKSDLIVEQVPIVAHCPKCAADRTLPTMQSFICPICRTPLSEIIHGRELEVVALEIEDLEVPCPES
jgi:hydrogenase nickel incorporation protein HypA/HybF